MRAPGEDLDLTPSTATSLGQDIDQLASGSLSGAASTLIRCLLVQIIEIEAQNCRNSQNRKLKEDNLNLIERAFSECAVRLNTRLAFQFCFERALASARRDGRHLSLIVVAGLPTREFQEVFERCKRADAAPFCWGVSEHVILLETDASGAEQFVERLLEAATSNHVERTRDFAPLRCTAAAASFPSTSFESTEEMFDAAKRAAMQQKERRSPDLSQVMGMEPAAILEQRR